MLKSLISNRKGSSSNQIDIQDISDGIIKISNSSYCQVVSASSVNFELKSEEEQDALIDTFEDFLNSIGFPIQFLIRIREIDIDDYLEAINEKIDIEAIDIFKEQLKSYHNFISSLVSSNKILTRTFYLVIPFEADKKSDRALIKNQLALRVDIAIKNLARLGIRCNILNSIEIIDLFYTFYSPELSKTQPISELALQVINKEFIKGARR